MIMLMWLILKMPATKKNTLCTMPSLNLEQKNSFINKYLNVT